MLVNLPLLGYKLIKDTSHQSWPIWSVEGPQLQVFIKKSSSHHRPPILRTSTSRSRKPLCTLRQCTPPSTRHVRYQKKRNIRKANLPRQPLRNLIIIPDSKDGKILGHVQQPILRKYHIRKGRGAAGYLRLPCWNGSSGRASDGNAGGR